MAEPSSTRPPVPVLPGAVFAPPRPEHKPPESQTDAELEQTIERLRLKLRSARRSLALARAAGVALAVFFLAAGFALLWIGPAPFFERFLGRAVVTTTYDAIAWWIAVVVLAILGGAFADQLLRGRLRLTRGWQHRVRDLSRRLEDAELARRRRSPA